MLNFDEHEAIDVVAFPQILLAKHWLQLNSL